MQKPPISLAVIALSALGTVSSLAQSGFFQAPTGPGNTWNVYQIEFGGKTFATANTDANANVRDFGTGALNGHLVAIGSLPENSMIWRWGDRGDIWIGLSDREGVAPGAQESQTFAPANNTNGWAWTSGDPFVFQNWGGGEPNDAGGAEDAAHIRNDGMWNDNGSGYGLDLPITPVIQVGTSAAEGGPTFKSALEWETNSVAPLAGVRMGNVFADLASPAALPGPSGTAGAWGVREITGVGVGNVFDAVDVARSGAGTITDGSFAVLDTADPETNGTPAGSVPGFVNPFLTNTPADDNNIITVAKATIAVTEAGAYTFQVRSDDGFALRLPGNDWTSFNGPEQAGIDPLDPQTLFFRNGTGDADTRGTINLPVGNHEIELLVWEGGGGAFYELSSTKGAVANANGANWILVGDSGTSFGMQAIIDPVQLNGDLTVHKVDGAVPDPGLGFTITTTNTAVANGTQSFVTSEPDTLFGEAELPGADDNFMLRVDGSFNVSDGDGTLGESIALTFTLRTDDGSALRILGEDFASVGGDARAALLDIGGDNALAGDFYTGNTDIFGHISLVEGQNYDFNAYMFEGGGGSRFELLVALGTVSNINDANFFVLDQSTSNIFRPANEGLALVPEPSTGLLALLGAGLFLRRRHRS